MKKKSLGFLLVFLTGWLGGMAAQFICPVTPADAAARILQADQLWLYGPDGQHRIQLATYSNPGEQGLPLIGLSDNSGHLRMLLRLAGPNGSPVLVFKDKNGADRMVIGLNYSGADEVPFINYTDAAGNPRSLFDQGR